MSGPFDFDFSEAEFRELIRKIEEGIKKLGDEISPSLRPLLDEFFNKIRLITPPWVKDAAYKALNLAIEAIEAFLNGLVELIQGIMVPITATQRAWTWHGDIDFFDERATALNDSMEVVALSWKGGGASSFATFGQRQVTEVGKLKDLTSSMRNGYAAMALAGLALYVGTGLAIAKAVAGASAGAASTPVTGPGGPAAAGAAAGVGALEIAGIIAGFTALIEPCVQIAMDVSSKSNDLRSSWPKPETDRYNDGSASDGDGSDWSTER